MNHSDYVTKESMRAWRAENRELRTGPFGHRHQRRVWRSFTPAQKVGLAALAIVCFPAWVVVMLVQAA